MTARRSYLKIISAFVSIAFSGFFGLIATSAQAGEVWLTIDNVRAYNLPEPISAIVVGNPGIADVKVVSNTNILLFGKKPGLTNIYFFDLEGKKLDNVSVRVRSNTGNMLTLQRGVEYVTYSCTTNCDISASVSVTQNVFRAAKDANEEKAQQLSTGGS